MCPARGPHAASAALVARPGAFVLFAWPLGGVAVGPVRPAAVAQAIAPAFESERRHRPTLKLAGRRSSTRLAARSG